MKKEDLRPFTFYRWIENTQQGKLDDVCHLLAIISVRE